MVRGISIVTLKKLSESIGNEKFDKVIVNTYKRRQDRRKQRLALDKKWKKLSKFV